MMLSNCSCHLKKGVTLAELSVSLTIISLIIATTFGGMTILKAAKIRKLATEFTTYMSAITEFEKQYSYLPGDLPTASSYWSGAHNGDGDGFVNMTNEDLYVWEHLAKANLITGSYTGLYVDSPTNSIKLGIDINSPGSEAFTTGAYRFMTDAGTSYYGVRGDSMSLTAILAGNGGVAVTSAKDAYSIDVKIDDGLASSGMFISLRTATNCVDADYTAASANYQLSDTTVDCRFMYWKKKF